MKILQQIGTLLLLGLNLQSYFVLKTLMGGVILGVFPAIFGMFRVITMCLNERDIHHFYLFKELKKFDKKEFIKMNIIGYLFLIVIYILLLNLWVARYFLGLPIFQILTWFLIGLTTSIFLYTIALFNKYELPIRQYIFQGFLSSIVGILETVAIALGMGIVIGIALVIPSISFFLGLPLLMLPHAWFSQAVVARLERVFYKDEEHDNLAE